MFKYLVNSSVKIDEVRRQTGETVDSYPAEYLDAEHKESLVAKVADDMKEMGVRGLAEYLDSRDLIKDVVETIIVTFQNGKAVAEVTASEELSPEQREALMDYISGQYSDGWGEGFEQFEFDYYHHDFEDEYEDEEEEENEEGEMETYAVYKTDIVNDKVEMYAHFWDNRDFDMTIELVKDEGVA